MSDNFPRGDYQNPAYTPVYFYSDYEDRYPRTSVCFMSGENQLQGYIYGMNNTDGLIVFAHGLGGGHENYMNEIIAMVDRGWRVFAYDATGSGESQGRGTKGLPQSLIDLDNALSYAETDERLNSLPVCTMGHSWGGYAAAAVPAMCHDIKGTVSVSGYYRPETELYEEAGRIFPALKYVLRPFIWVYNRAVFGKMSSVSAVDAINGTDIPVLVVHGDADEMISFDYASVYSQKDRITNPNAEFILITDELVNGHNSVLYSQENMKYVDEISPEFKKFNEEHENPTEAEAEAFINGFDRGLLNEINSGLFDKADSFLRSCIR